MQYYDPERDDPLDGIYLTAELLAMLRDLMRREQGNQEINLSAEGLSGFCELLIMMQQCLNNITTQLRERGVSS